jgi:dCTP deaminase
MILTDREIQIALDSKAILVDPTPSQNQYSSTSLDLTLDPVITKFKRPKTGVGVCIDPSLSGFDHEAVLADLGAEERISETTGYDFQPGEMLLAWTREYLKLPTTSRIAARVEGKSSLARLGVGIHLTAPTIHAGFDGQIRLEMVNHNLIPIKLRIGMRICQLIFEQTIGTPVKGYVGRFSGQAAGTQRG